LCSVLPPPAPPAISFALLALSSTPAVAAFGITVTVGVGFNLWLAGVLSENE